MSLSLTVNHALQIIREPGFWQDFSAQQIFAMLNPADTASHRGFWQDRATHTLTLQPKQLDPTWKDTASQLDSIVGLVDRGSGKLQFNSSNIITNAIFEANIKQNSNNPFIFTSPIPGTGGIVAELAAQLAIVALDDKSQFPLNTTDSRVICYTEEKLKGNQALYLRWLAPDSQSGGAAYMGFCIGEFALVFIGSMLEIFQDTGPEKNREVWQRVMGVPLFSGTSDPLGSNSGAGVGSVVGEVPWEQRAILWLPFHRNLVYIESSAGKWCVLNTRTIARLNGLEGNDQDWDIVDDKELLVFGLSASVGAFQIQKVKWYDGDAKLVLPHIVVDYAPGDPLGTLNFVDDIDAYRGSALTHSSPLTPPGYDNYANILNDCPPQTTVTGDQSRTYGITYTFTASSDRRYAPFMYGVEVRIPEVVGTWPVSPTTISDVAPDLTADNPIYARIVHATLSAEWDKPALCRMEADVVDQFPFTLDTLQYKSHYPLRLDEITDGPTTTRLFLGITKPTVVEPQHFNTNRPRALKFDAQGLWKLLDEHLLRDQRDWTGTGHIQVVDFVARQAGIDTTGADYPKKDHDLAAIGGSYDMPLGGIDPREPNYGNLKKVWQPKDTMSAADFILRIAQQFSGYKVGFYPDGVFYYLPAEPAYFYNTSEVTFYKSRNAHRNGPCYEDPVQTMITEPEANVVAAVGTTKAGQKIKSSLFIDWPSILNPAAPNFIGRWRPEIITVDGTVTCVQLNWIAQTAWMQARRAFFMVRFKGDYVPTLKLGRVFTLEGQTGLWRLLKVEAEFLRNGIRKANYEAFRAGDSGYL